MVCSWVSCSLLRKKENSNSRSKTAAKASWGRLRCGRDDCVSCISWIGQTIFLLYWNLYFSDLASCLNGVGQGNRVSMEIEREVEGFDYAGVEGESKAQTVRGRRTTQRRGRISGQKWAAGVGSKQHPIHSTQMLGESLCTCTLQIIFWCNIVLHNVV